QPKRCGRSPGGVGGAVVMALVLMGSLPQLTSFWPGVVAFAMIVAAPILAGTAFRRSRRRGWPVAWLMTLIAGVGLTGVGLGLVTAVAGAGSVAIATGVGLSAWSLTAPQRAQRRWQRRQDRAIPP
ncbi:MAG: hypothetical protein HC918_06520, partial [Oscillatoriales cyanobacterium SM2_1_8]|nr:hypothetical protein [Oscillatoriales cyanobacterium SM2_1_8]